MAEVYLGDGLYASFTGGMIKLRAPRPGGDDEVFLERSVFNSLVEVANVYFNPPAVVEAEEAIATGEDKDGR